MLFASYLILFLMEQYAFANYFFLFMLACNSDLLDSFALEAKSGSSSETDSRGEN